MGNVIKISSDLRVCVLLESQSIQEKKTEENVFEIFISSHMHSQINSVFVRFWH